MQGSSDGYWPDATDTTDGKEIAASQSQRFTVYMSRKAVLAMVSTASGGVALLAIAWLAARRLTGTDLGYFFSFLSFGALIQLADFGLSYAALQTAGHLAGTDRLHELPGLAKRVAAWNLFATCLATAAVAALGVVVFPGPDSDPAVLWQRPWAGYLLAVFANQLTIPRLALREGGGKVSQVWAVRLVQEWAAGLACLIALQVGAGLWSLSIFVGARALVATLWLVGGDPLPAVEGAPPFSLDRWMSEVWPFQWKIGLSFLSGFLIFRAFTPIVFYENGPVAAGQFGLAISMMNLLISVSSAWPMSQAARYAALNAGGRFGELRREFPVMLWASTALAAVATVTLSVALWQARRFGFAIALSLPDPYTTAVVLATAVIHHFVVCFAVYLRAEGREPLLVASVGGGVFTATAIWLTAHFATLRDVAMVNLGCAIIGIPIVLFLSRGRMSRDDGARERRQVPSRQDAPSSSGSRVS